MILKNGGDVYQKLVTVFRDIKNLLLGQPIF